MKKEMDGKKEKESFSKDHNADEFGVPSNIINFSSIDKSGLKSICRLINNCCSQVLSIIKIF